MSTRILILKDGVITPSRSSSDITAINTSLGITASLALKANLVSPALTGTPTAPTATAGTNTTQIANTAFVTNALTTKADLVGGLIPSSQLPGYVDDILEYNNLASFPTTGESGKLYIAADTNLVYRWAGSTYGITSASLALGITSSTAYRGDFGNTAYNHSQIVSGNPHGVTAALIGLGNVTNTSDINKPISTAQQTALDLKANLNSPILVTPNLGTPSAGILTNATGLPLTGTTGTLAINRGGTGSATQNFVDLTTTQTVGGDKTYTGIKRIQNSTQSTSTTTGAHIVAGGQAVGGNQYVGGDIKVRNAWLLETRSGGAAQDLNTQVYGQFAGTKWFDGSVTNTNTPVGANAGMLLQFDPLFGTGATESKYRVQEFITSNRWWKRMESNAVWQTWYELPFLNKAQTFTSIQNFTTQININETKVIGARDTGWTAPTGTANKGAFASDTATLLNVAQRLFSIETALRNHGLLGT